MTFARKAAEMDQERDEKQRSNSFNRFPGISSSRPNTNRRRHSGSSVGSLSNSRDGLRPRSSRDAVDKRPRSSSSNRRDSKSMLPRVVGKRGGGGMEGNKGRAFDSLISTPPVSAASTSSEAFGALISTPSGDRRPGSEFTNASSRGGGSADTSKGAFQSLEELEYVS
eukprot:g2979.t1